MDFIHEPYQPGETIAAIATPIGDGGIAIIRISGNRALQIADAIFSGKVQTYTSHTAHYGKILDSKGCSVDHALLLVMRQKQSFTGEDTVEVHCHGGRLITKRVLEVILHAGARAARPGEFSFRAFMNGKMDLAQAEAVQELICAKNEHALHAADEQLQGKLSSKISHFQTEMTQIAAIIEAWVDFPEEGLEFASVEEICQDLDRLCTQMQHLINTFNDGKIIHDGISLCLVGRPNVGKSSLMNALLDQEKVIVSSIPGTTRDLVEGDMRLKGLNLRLIDTAGIRETMESIELEGVKRTRHVMTQADLILFVLDVSQGVQEEERLLLHQLPKDKTILAWNKRDLGHKTMPTLHFPHTALVSAKQKWGIEDLQEKIHEVIWENGPPEKEGIVITNLRHQEALCHAVVCAKRVIEGLQMEQSPEFLALDIRQCLNELGKIIGTNVTEDILSSIFSKFCVGK